MSAKTMTGYFKDSGSRFGSIQSKRAQKMNIHLLWERVQMGPDSVAKLLWNGNKPEKGERSDRKEAHNACGYKIGTDSNKPTEKRMCRCMYYLSKDVSQSKCKTCTYSNKWFHLPGDGITIEEYEIPSSYVIGDIGGVDLVFNARGQKYNVEIKPIGSHETIIRMLAETLTYHDDDRYRSDYKPAICIFRDDNNDQWKQYKELENDSDFLDIIEQCQIGVFCIDVVTATAKGKTFSIEQIK